MSEFTVTKLNNVFDIEGIITVHYFEYVKNYIFTGEQHDFWELVYVDKGEVGIFSDGQWKDVKCGNIVFHRPMQHHNLKANGNFPPNAAVITFKCHSLAMELFDNLITPLHENETLLIAKIIELAKKAFTNPLDDPYTTCLTKSGDDASEQLIKVYLEELILLLYTRLSKKTFPRTENKSNRSTTSEAIEYMNLNLHKNLLVSDIAAAIMKSTSDLKRAFHKSTGMGVITYFRNLKINHAKQLLRQGEMNITEISQKLGYNNVHHFSKQFKTVTGMSPREYIKSIKQRLESASI
ncbi:MAG: helix-turn-helix domain-containing protein [Ruminococcaceae bacterium]|nr:helix-turn-helix domain-containing protein [Oscillospiraceae bacterium]